MDEEKLKKEVEKAGLEETKYAEAVGSCKSSCVIACSASHMVVLEYYKEKEGTEE